jgi:aminopeptidase N
MTQTQTSTQPMIKYRKDYQPCEFIVNSMECCFELHPEKTQVHTTLKIQLRDPLALKNLENLPPKKLILNGDTQHPDHPNSNGMKLISLEKDQIKLTPEDYKLDPENNCLEILIQPKANNPVIELKIHTEINPKANTALSGLYLSSDVFCTQCEAEGFRHITYFFDRPDVMTSYRTKIIADKTLYPVLLSNGNLIEKGDLTNNQHYVIWEDPFKKPCYLFALVAGDLKAIRDFFITRSGRKVLLEIYLADEKKLDQCLHAMESLKYAMKWDEENYDCEYDLDIYMIVAVDDFNMGAMENKGLNVFNTKYILAHPRTATDMDFSHVLTVVGHEYFHNWTGNRITCQDWFQLSLKEGLTVFRDQEFTADFYSKTLKRIEEVNIIQSLQFSEDASPMAHPIRPDSYIEMNNFYTVTVYNKGAEVIRMQQTILGKEGFKRGMDLYFSRHDGQAVTCEDFIRCMEEANAELIPQQADLSLFRNWYSQDGTPEVIAEEYFDHAQHTYTLKFSQHCKDSVNQKNKKPFHIPISMALLDPKTGTEITAEILHLKEFSQSFIFKNISQKPIPSLLRDFSAPVKLKFAYSIEDLIFLATHDPNEFNRWESAQTLFKQKLLKDFQSLISSPPEANPKAHTESDLNKSPKENTRPAPESYTPYIQTIRAILNSDCDPGLIAEAVSLPSERILSELMDTELINPEAIHLAREYFQEAIQKALRTEWENTYRSMQDLLNSSQTSIQSQPQPQSTINGQLISQRQLKNLALSQLIHSKTGEELALNQLYQANNMSDQSAAFSTILQSKNKELREKASQYFYEKNRSEPLTLNKFFQIHASGNYPELIQDIQKLSHHPDFTFENPNRVYALFVTFSMNSFYFHQADGAGYELFKSAILKLNIFNPQVASRLVKTLMNFKRFEPLRAGKMREVLEQLRTEELSPNVYEIVHKALEDI